MKNFECKYNVSRETFDLLKRYEASLNEWQKRMNLVSKNSLPEAWQRHFLDSMQLFQYIPENAKLVYDLGSGAGFPGMVLAIMALEKTPYLNFKLVESISKKTLYLNHVKELCGLDNVEVLNQRIENLPVEKADVITSRALASLEDLLSYAEKFCSVRTQCVFLKGKSFQSEIDNARAKWSFKYNVVPSSESSEGVILIITDIHKRR